MFVSSSQPFTIILYSYCSLAFFTFWCQKVTKNRAVVYGIRCLKVDNTAFPHPVRCKLRLHYARLTAGGIVDLQANSRVALRHLSVGSHLATRCLSQCLGRQELAALKHHATCFQSLLGYSLCLPTLPFRFQRRITFAAMNSRMIRELYCVKR